MFKRNAMTYLQVSMTIVATCLCGLSFIQASSKDDDKPPRMKRVIEAEEFRVVDKDGKIRAVLTVHPGEKEKSYYADKPGLYLYRKNESLAAFLMVNGDENGYLSIKGDDGSCCAEIGMANRQPTGHQGGFLTITDTDSNGVHLGVTMEGWTKPPTPASTIKVFKGPKREVIWEAK